MTARVAEPITSQLHTKCILCFCQYWCRSRACEKLSRILNGLDLHSHFSAASFSFASTNKMFQLTAGKFVPLSNKTMMNVCIYFKISSYVHKGVAKRVFMLFSFNLEDWHSCSHVTFCRRCNKISQIFIRSGVCKS